jgi:hypothetical protein
MKNALKYTKTEVVSNTRIKVDIRLSDDCNNGHQDFSITCQGWERRSKNGKFYESFAGCAHDEILKMWPQFQIFVNLHLCDYLGRPMHTVANGFYHLKNAFTSTQGRTHEEQFCEYYRVTPEQYGTLKGAENQLEFSILLMNLGILDQWKVEADEAIKILEELTGEKFLIDSKISQFKEPKQEEVQEFNKLKEEGYFSAENKLTRAEQRAQELKEKKIQEVNERADKDIKKANDERTVKLFVLSHGLSIENFIYYNHNQEAVFNWSDHNREKVTEEQFNSFIENLDTSTLPVGIIFKLGKK